MNCQGGLAQWLRARVGGHREGMRPGSSPCGNKFVYFYLFFFFYELLHVLQYCSSVSYYRLFSPT